MAVPTVSIIIPVYNEAASIEALLRKVLAVKIPARKDIIIVEGCSTDGTERIVDRWAGEHGIRVYHVTVKGKGYKVRFGIERAAGQIIMIQDADLEYDPADYPDVLAPILAGRAKVVLGSRHMRAKTWKIRQLDKSRWYGGIINLLDRILKRCFWLITGRYLTDPNTMYKVFRKDCLEGIHLQSDNFDLDMELLIKLLRKGYRPIEVPVSYQGRSIAQGKKIRILKDGLRHVIAIVRFRFGKL
jgi:glycosyltransferase involved in cell wall biosynthesis